MVSKVSSKMLQQAGGEGRKLETHQVESGKPGGGKRLNSKMGVCEAGGRWLAGNGKLYTQWLAVGNESYKCTAHDRKESEINDRGESEEYFEREYCIH